MTVLEARIKQLEKAIARLDESLNLPQSDITRDSSILRFEMAIELAWKTLKVYLEDQKKVIVKNPVDTFRVAYQQDIIEYSDEWIEFVKLRNEIAHTYKEELANQMYSQLPKVLKRLKELLNALEV